MPSLGASDEEDGAPVTLVFLERLVSAPPRHVPKGGKLPQGCFPIATPGQALCLIPQVRRGPSMPSGKVVVIETNPALAYGSICSVTVWFVSDA